MINIKIDYDKWFQDNVKELRIDLRLYHGYTAKEVRKMKHKEVIEKYREAMKDYKVYGCKLKQD